MVNALIITPLFMLGLVGYLKRISTHLSLACRFWTLCEYTIKFKILITGLSKFNPKLSCSNRVHLREIDAHIYRSPFGQGSQLCVVTLGGHSCGDCLLYNQFWPLENIMICLIRFSIIKQYTCHIRFTNWSRDAQVTRDPNENPISLNHHTSPSKCVTYDT